MCIDPIVYLKMALLAKINAICALSTIQKKKRTKHVNSVVVLVAQRRARRVQDIPDPDSRADIVHVHGGVQGERVARLVSSINVAQTERVLVLPDAEVAVDEGVVQEEDGVGGRAVRVGHDSADAVVAPRVRGTLRAAGHVAVCALVVASVNHTLVGVGGGRVVVVAGKAMKLVAGAGTDVDGEVGELLESC
jgi:hypothetical protein